MEVIITDHAMLRRKRLGLSKQAFTRKAQKAYDEGICHKDAVGRLHKYMDKLYLTRHTVNQCRVHSEMIWIYKDNLLITVLHLDNHLKKLLK